MNNARGQSSLGLVKAVHCEFYVGSRSGGSIGVICDCELGTDHTYAEWVARLGEGKYNGSGDPADIHAVRAARDAEQGVVC
ncbi:hypothetical protein ACFOYW_08085 [Gryllotalpicola reticulitermitis]|uniref:Uncharacterized protein n=1 Tax=Gryllotalpicola reticulitermitis TaxID=1184153 RepID=A0ABV8Q4N8_9MICO